MKNYYEWINLKIILSAPTRLFVNSTEKIADFVQNIFNTFTGKKEDYFHEI